MAKLFQALNRKSSLEKIIELIRKGEDVNYVSPNGVSTIDQFYKKIYYSPSSPISPEESGEIIEEMFRAGANPAYFVLHIHSLLFLKDIAPLVAVLDYNPNAVNLPDKNGSTPFLRVCTVFRGIETFYSERDPDLHRYMEVINLLLDRGADPALANKRGDAPIHALVTNTGITDSVLTVIERIWPDINLSAETEDGSTTLHFLADRGPDLYHHDVIDQVDFAQTLIDSGVDPNQKGYRRLTALDRARENGNVPMIRFLESYSHSPNTQGGRRRSRLSKTRKGKAKRAHRTRRRR